MSGLVKDCKRCKKPFMTWSIKVSESIEFCDTCRNIRREETMTKKKTDKFHNDIIAIEDRMKSIEQHTENMMDNMSSVVNAEILNLTQERLEGITQQFLNDFKQEVNKMLKKFEKKMQKQNSIMHTRLKEMEKVLGEYLGAEFDE